MEKSLKEYQIVNMEYLSLFYLNEWIVL